MPLLAGTGLLLRAKGRLYYACVCRAMPYRSGTLSVREEDVIRLERNDTKMVEWVCNVRAEDKISAELRTRLKFKTVRECLGNGRSEACNMIKKDALAVVFL